MTTRKNKRHSKIKKVRKNKTYKHYNFNKNKKSKKNKYIRRKKNFSKKNRKYKSKLMKVGGYGQGSCPFVTPPDPWNANGYSYIYPKSKNGVAVGGVPVYPGTTQQGGNILQKITPQFLLNTGRVLGTSTKNFINNYNGVEPEVSPLPMYDQLTNQHLAKRGL
tara:strand:- start:801 stop:1289 length:489 start_codon:yes stop_codon:yes gene_type:complete